MQNVHFVIFGSKTLTPVGPEDFHERENKSFKGDSVFCPMETWLRLTSRGFASCCLHGHASWPGGLGQRKKQQPREGKRERKQQLDSKLKLQLIPSALFNTTLFLFSTNSSPQGFMETYCVDAGCYLSDFVVTERCFKQTHFKSFWTVNDLKFACRSNNNNNNINDNNSHNHKW